jgi:heptosyltransferase-3
MMPRSRQNDAPVPVHLPVEAMTPASLLSDLAPGSRLLVIRLRSIGDIILLTPALHLLKTWRPDLRVSVVVESRFRELLEDNPDVEELLNPGEGDGLSRLASRLRAIREIRRRDFAVCLNLHGGPTSRLLTRASGARCKVGFAHFRARGMYDVLIPDACKFLGQPSIHTAEHQAAALFYLGMPRQEIPRARLTVRTGHVAWWREQRTRCGLASDQAYALVHPTALFRTKQWAAEKFAQLGDYLEHHAGLSPLYSCGPGETGVLDAVERAASTRISRLESASLGQFAAALADCRIFIGNDSGPAHMAAALERPLVVIFGSSSSVIWGPWPRSESAAPARVVQNPYDCNPCPGNRCYFFERPECILSVSFEQVRAAVDDVLAKSAG